MSTTAKPSAPELLCPAGEIDAAYAAFHFGADAVYAGLKRFSARAEAVNLSPAELGEICAYAHSLTPRRRVYLTLNTLVSQDELPGVLETLQQSARAGVDALIVQDLGVARLARRHFPRLRLHASTQLAVHNLSGACMLRDLGFSRVTLARELCLDEVRAISVRCGIETEIFIHGALCYSYSGLCLFSSLLRGRSGNRGRCLYPCRELYACGERQALPFSMKDLALLDRFPEVLASGASSLKIEGRKKSPLYVAAATDLYRGLVDGRSPDAIAAAAAGLKTVFSRPWTSLYIDAKGTEAVIDPRWTGHRGEPIGVVAAIRKPSGQPARLCFAPLRPLDRHDGLQLDIPGNPRPFGFAVGRLWISAGRGQKPAAVFGAPAGGMVEIELPAGYPHIPEGTQVYCSSSQAVKKRYEFDRPKPGLYAQRLPVSAALEISAESMRVCATVECADMPAVSAETGCPLPPELPKLDSPSAFEQAAHQAFSKLGDTPFVLSALTINNPAGVFIPVSLLNRARREASRALSAALEDASREALSEIIRREGTTSAPITAPAVCSIKVDRALLLDEFTPAEWRRVHEVILEIDQDSLAVIEEKLAVWAGFLPRDKIRLALPMITRAPDEEAILAKASALIAAGWRRWQVSNIGGWRLLGGVTGSGLEISTDWPCYAMNSQAAREWLELGASSVTLSPEDTRGNCVSMVKEFGDRAVLVVYQDTPLFVSETPPEPLSGAQLEKRLESRKGEKILIIQRDSRTWVVAETPQRRADWIEDLRAAGGRHFRMDFILRSYSPAQVRDLWVEITPLALG